MKVIDYLGDNKFVVEMKELDEGEYMPNSTKIHVQHDYVGITRPVHVDMQRKEDGTYPYTTKRGFMNCFDVEGYIQIPIRDMIEVLLPYLNKHPYCQKEHIKDIKRDHDDKYYTEYGLDKPRYKKGDMTPNYAYYGSVIHFQDEGMVTFRRFDSVKYVGMPKDLFECVKDSLKLSLDKYQLVKYNKENPKK